MQNCCETIAFRVFCCTGLFVRDLWINAKLLQNHCVLQYSVARGRLSEAFGSMQKCCKAIVFYSILLASVVCQRHVDQCTGVANPSHKHDMERPLGHWKWHPSQQNISFLSTTLAFFSMCWRRQELEIMQPLQSKMHNSSCYNAHFRFTLKRNADFIEFDRFAKTCLANGGHWSHWRAIGGDYS